MFVVLLKIILIFFTHDYNTRDSGTTIALPKVKLDFDRRRFYFLDALPLNIRQISSKVLFRESLDQFFV